MTATRTEQLPASLITTAHEVYDPDEGAWVRVTARRVARSGGIILQLADGTKFCVGMTFRLDTRQADRA